MYFLTSKELGQLLIQDMKILREATERGYVTVQEIEYLLGLDEKLFKTVSERSVT